MSSSRRKKKEKPQPPPNLNEGPIQDGEIWVYKYGVRHPSFFSEVELELYCFRTGRTRAVGGLGRYGHFRRVCDILWPRLMWSEWLERQIQSLCENQWLCWAGCAASGKTFSAALFAMVFWLCDPLNTSVVLTSTTAKMIRKRSWSAIRKLYYDCWGFPGNMVDSKTVLQATKGDDKNAVFAQAVAEGDTSSAVANIQGIHNRRIMVIIDEATETPQAAFDACVNLFAGCTEFICLVIGNPASRMDQMGRFAEPMDGWQSVSVEDDEWQTRIQLNGKPGLVLRFDAEKSPNVLAQKTLFPFLVKKEELDGAKVRLGENSPQYWKFYRGFWAPDGVLKTVLSESLVVKMNGMGKFVFSGRKHLRIAGCDPAFGGGDRAILRLGECGDSDGKQVIQLTERFLLNIDAAAHTPVHFQLADQIKKICEDHGIEPDCIAMDATGEGGGLCDILARNWSPKIIRVEFGGAASEDRVSSEDMRQCKDVYERMVAQLWFQFREYLLAGQLKGLDPSSIRQFCNRTYDDISKKKIFLQTKKDMRNTYGESPDYADADVLVVEAARRKGIMVTPILTAERASNTWVAFVRGAQQVHADTYAEVEI